MSDNEKHNEKPVKPEDVDLEDGTAPDGTPVENPSG